MATQKITDADFSTFVHSTKPVLVDFWAAWCQPCKRMAPILEAISEQYSDTLIVGKLDVDQNPVTASQFKIQSIPTMILFQEGEPVKQIVGFRPQSDLLAQLADVL